MLAADAAFLQIVSDTCTARGAVAMLPDLVDALDAVVCKSMSTFQAQQFGALVQAEVTPAAVAAFHADLIGASPLGALPNNATSKDVVFHLVGAVRKELGLATAAATPKAGSVAQDAVDVYKDAAYYHGLQVQNSDKATFVTDARKDLIKHGHITEAPSLTKMRRLGVTGGSKRKLAIGGATDETATLSIDEAKAKPVTTMQDAKHMARVLVYGLIAVYAVPIGKTVLGGRDKGWVTVPGEARQVRVVLSMQVAMNFLWALTDSPLTDVRAFMRMVDAVMVEFIDEAARMTEHPDEVIETLISTRKGIFRVDPGGAEETAEAPVSAPTESPASATPKGNPKGECLSWLTNGVCNDKDCIYPHHENRKGLAQGSRARGGGGRRGNGGGGARSYSYAPYPPPPPYAAYPWYGAPPAKGKGGGKGGGGKKGRGGGGGQEWGWGW